MPGLRGAALEPRPMLEERRLIVLSAADVAVKLLGYPTTVVRSTVTVLVEGPALLVLDDFVLHEDEYATVIISVTVTVTIFGAAAPDELL